MQSKGLPRHVGIIMDGNGRWAKKRGLPRSMGHRQGAKTFEKIVERARERGVEYLTVYAFSTENRTRPTDEINTIKGLLRQYIDNIEKYRDDPTIRLHFLGDISWLGDEYVLGKIAEIEADYIKLSDAKFTLNIAFNYGGRDEILRAVKKIAADYPNTADNLTEQDFSRYLYTAGQPDIDLVIRTSGELRTSNFLLWQSAYAEYIFTETLWPDFSPKHFDAALEEFSRRERRIGGVTAK